MGKSIIDCLQGRKAESLPFWFMRQAGRYLPEYRELRIKAGSFMDLCFNPGMAAEVTLQPIRRFNMSAAILFSDILVIPHALGQEVKFVKGEGPKLDAFTGPEALKFSPDILSPIYETVARVKKELDEKTALIGFCGAPWTVACYMIEGGGSRDFAEARRYAVERPQPFLALLDKVVDASIHYLGEQVKAGAEVLQLFDSWAGIASVEQFRKYIIPTTKKIVAEMKKTYPQVPVIGFPRAAGVMLGEYAKETGVDGVSVDFSTPLEYAKEVVPQHVTIQGNLDPLLIATDINTALKQSEKIIQTMQGRRFIFNYGHGMLPHTPVEHVERLSEFLCAQR